MMFSAPPQSSIKIRAAIASPPPFANPGTMVLKMKPRMTAVTIHFMISRNGSVLCLTVCNASQPTPATMTASHKTFTQFS